MVNLPTCSFLIVRSSWCFRIFSRTQLICLNSDFFPFLGLKTPLTIFVAVFIMSEPLISICIPAYKKPQYVVRCLESILKQDYTSVEVIISDDSPDEDIKQVIQPFRDRLRI